METARFSDTLAFTKQFTPRLNPKEQQKNKIVSFGEEITGTKVKT
jgi:hypothetical protein